MMIAPAEGSLGGGSGEWCEDDIVDENDSDVDRVGKSSREDWGSGVVDEGGSGGVGNPGEEKFDRTYAGDAAPLRMGTLISVSERCCESGCESGT